MQQVIPTASPVMLISALVLSRSRFRAANLKLFGTKKRLFGYYEYNRVACATHANWDERWNFAFYLTPGCSFFYIFSHTCFAKCSSVGSRAPISKSTQSFVKWGRTVARKSLRSSAKKADLPIVFRSLIRSPAEISFVVVPPA